MRGDFSFHDCLAISRGGSEELKVEVELFLWLVVRTQRVDPEMPVNSPEEGHKGQQDPVEMHRDLISGLSGVSDGLLNELAELSCMSVFVSRFEGGIPRT